MVFASRAMLGNYSKFGDLLAFDVYDGLLRNTSHDNERYKVAMFTVCDTNIRLLFAGLALFVDETTPAMFSILDMFIQLHGKTPSSIISKGQQSVALAVEELRDHELFTGAHMLDTCYLLETVKPKIMGD